MSRQWYCRIGGVERGPMPAAELKALAASGRLSASDWVRDAESDQWSQATKVRGLKFANAEAKPQAKPDVKGQAAAQAKPEEDGKCPACQAELPLLAVLCVQCGYDRRTGKKVKSADASDPPALVPAELSSRSPKRMAMIAALAAVCLVSVATAIGVFVKLSAKVAEAEREAETSAARNAAPAMATTANPPLVNPPLTSDGEPAPVGTNHPETPFEHAFSMGWIEWEPISNVELTTRGPEGEKTQSFGFVNNDLLGGRMYGWGDRSARFGVDATIRITRDGEVAEGILRVGDRWTFTGERWRLAAAELPSTPLSEVAAALAAKKQAEVPSRDGATTTPTPDSPTPEASAFGGATTAGVSRFGAVSAPSDDMLLWQLREVVGRLPSTTFATPIDRFNARAGLDAATLDAWAAALQKASGGSLGREEAFQFLVDYDYPFSGAGYDAKRGLLLMTRLSLLPPSAAEAWRKAAEALHPDLRAGDHMALANLLGMVVAQEPLFAGETYAALRQAKFNARLATLPPEAARRFAEQIKPEVAASEGVTALEIQAALSLIFADALFEGDRFHPPAMEKAMKIAADFDLRKGEIAEVKPPEAVASPPPDEVAVADATAAHELPEGSLRVLGYSFVERAVVEDRVGTTSGPTSTYPVPPGKQLVWVVVEIVSSLDRQLRTAGIQLHGNGGASWELKGIGHSERPLVQHLVGAIDLGGGAVVLSVAGETVIERSGETLRYDASLGTLSFSKTPRVFGFLFAADAAATPRSLSIFGGEIDLAGRAFAARPDEDKALDDRGSLMAGGMPASSPLAVELPEPREPPIPVVVDSAAGFAALPLSGVARTKLRQKQVAAAEGKMLLSIELHLSKEIPLPAELDLSELQLIGSHSGAFPVYGIGLAGATLGEPQLRLILGDGARYAPPAGLPEKIDLKHSKAGEFQFTSASGVLACKRLPGKLVVVFLIPQGSSLPEPEEWRLANLFGGVVEVSELIHEARGAGGFAGAAPGFGPTAPVREKPVRE